MPGGQYDSSKTRVAPIFDRLHARGGDWVRQLLVLPHLGGSVEAAASDLDLTFIRGFWGTTERGLMPPVSLLSWLVRNLAPPTDGSEPDDRRARLIARDARTIEEALSLLRTAGEGKMWQVLEGPTYPDAILETPDAFIVIEGKRTEAGPTTKTKWMAGRHQMWRHLDAAWEVRGPRQVFGFFLVEGQAPDLTEVPRSWREAAALTVSESVMESSLPHRGLREREQLIQTFLGVATWQHVCAAFGIAPSDLPETVSDLGTRSRRDVAINGLS